MPRLNFFSLNLNNEDEFSDICHAGSSDGEPDDCSAGGCIEF